MITYPIVRAPWMTRPMLGQKPQPPPGVNCQATQDGGVVCSDGRVFPPG